MSELTRLMRELRVNMQSESPHLLARKRWKYLPGLFRDLGFTKGAEIGVEDGAFSKRLYQVIPDLTLYSIDPWISYGYYIGQRKYDQAGMDKKYAGAVEALSPFNCKIVREFSHIAVEQFDNASLDFVHIDAAHSFFDTYRDIMLWTPKIRPGGILSGHDYFNAQGVNRCRVKDAVDQWTRECKIAHWFVIVGSHTPSWFWEI